MLLNHTARLTLATTIALASLASSARAVTLINPDGTPVGGNLQTWANQAKAPTIAGPLTIVTPASMGCAAQGGCSVRGTTAATTRDTLYFELGHQFDWTYLTSQQRNRLARMWGHPRAPWNDTLASLAAGSEDGLMADFATAYDQCATTGMFIGATWPGHTHPPTIRTVTSPTATCKLITRSYATHR